MSDVQREDAAFTAGPWEVYSQSEDEGWSDHLGWQGSIRSTTDKDADWVAVTIYRKADALLMAAAPDLLAALADLIDPPFGAYRRWAQFGETRDADRMDEWQAKHDRAKALLEQFGRSDNDTRAATCAGPDRVVSGRHFQDEAVS